MNLPWRCSWILPEIKTFSTIFYFVTLPKYIAILLCMCYNFKLTDYEVLRCTKEYFYGISR